MRLECPLVLNLNPRLELSHVYHDPDLFDHCSKECNGHSCKKDRNQVGGKKDGHEVCIPRGTTRPCQGHATAMPGA